MGSLSVFQADNEEELDIFYKKIAREIQNSYLRFEAVKDPSACVLIQEKIEGQEYGLDIINDLDCHYQNTIPKRKGAMRSGETDFAETVDNEDLKGLGERISSLLKHRGNLDMDVFEAGGKYYILEMNPRFGGGYPFSHAAGANFPKFPLYLLFWLLCGFSVTAWLNAWFFYRLFRPHLGAPDTAKESDSTPDSYVF